MNPNNNQAHPDADTLRTLTDKLIRILDEALDALPSQELLTDRQALRNLTGALKDLRELCPAPEPEAPSGDDAAPLTVSFLGDANELSE